MCPRPICRCYVLAGGASVPLLVALQKAASSWSAEDFSAAGLAELAWGLASCGQPVPEGCCQLLRAALQDDGSAADAAALGQHRLKDAEQPQDRQQQQQQQQQQEQLQEAPPLQQADRQREAPPQHVHEQAHSADVGQQERLQAGAAGPPVLQQEAAQAGVQAQVAAWQRRDWQAWFEGTPASKVSLLLWSAARLGCRPCDGCLNAAASALLRGRGLARLSSKVGWGG